MNHNHEKLPSSPFVEGTRYYGDSRDYRHRPQPTLVNEKNAVQEEQRIARREDIAKYALNNVLPESDVEKKEEEHLKRLFAFPDEGDDRMFMRTSVTQESLSDALDAYISTDDNIKQVVNKYAKDGHQMLNLDVAKTLRENNQLRYELGTYLLHLLSQEEARYYLQERHRSETERKRPNIAGYDEPMSSKEYSVLLALSMLDGTFKHSYKDNRPVDKIYLSKYDSGRVEAGQHRWVAFHLLGLKKRIYDYSEKRR